MGSQFPRCYCILTCGVIFLSTLFVLFSLLRADRIPRQLPDFRSQDAQEPKWLIATMSPVFGISRRMIIRRTWQSLFHEPSLWTTRFVVSRAANPTWQAIIEAENKTYGDIIQLSHLEETAHIANTVKSVEFFKYLAGTTMRTKTQPRVSLEAQIGDYEFVSKIDDDSFLDARSFFRNYLRPLKTKHRTIFARTVDKPNFNAPGGQFYTLTSDLVLLLADLHTENPIDDEDEDVLVGRLLYEAQQNWTHIDLPNPIAFDYEDTDLQESGKAFAAPDADLSGWRHAVGPESINPHKMRDDDTYIKVAACFNETGVIL